VLAQLCNIAINMFCVGCSALSLRVASLRAADLAWNNLLLAFASLYLCFLADVYRMTLRIYCRFRRVLGLIGIVLPAVNSHS